MASDWIRVRTAIVRDPKVILMTDFLAAKREFMEWLTSPVKARCESSAYEHVSRVTLRHVTVTACVTVWGVTREQGVPDNDDMIIPGITLDVLDVLAEIPCFGDAMASVGWAVELANLGGVRFPKFLKHNTPQEERYRDSAAKRAREYRARKTAKKSRDASRDASQENNVTRHGRGRVEGEDSIETSQTSFDPSLAHEPQAAPAKASAVAVDESFQAFWSIYPKKVGKQDALKAWKATAKIRPAVNDILAAVEAQKTGDNWTRESGRYVPNPATWIRQGRWDDVIPSKTATDYVF